MGARGTISPEEKVSLTFPTAQSHFRAAANLHDLGAAMSSGGSNDMMGSSQTPGAGKSNNRNGFQ